MRRCASSRSGSPPTRTSRSVSPRATASATVVKVTIYLRDMANFPKIVALRERWFTPPYPADTIVEVSSLYSPDALIEIEAVAVADAAAERSP